MIIKNGIVYKESSLQGITCGTLVRDDTKVQIGIDLRSEQLMLIDTDLQTYHRLLKLFDIHPEILPIGNYVPQTCTVQIKDGKLVDITPKWGMETFEQIQSIKDEDWLFCTKVAGDSVPLPQPYDPFDL